MRQGDNSGHSSQPNPLESLLASATKEGLSNERKAAEVRDRMIAREIQKTIMTNINDANIATEDKTEYNCDENSSMRKVAYSFADSDVGDENDADGTIMTANTNEDKEIGTRPDSPNGSIVSYINSIANESTQSCYDQSTARRPPSPDFQLVNTEQQWFEQEQKVYNLQIESVERAPAEVFYFLHNAVGASNDNNRASIGISGTADLYGVEGVTSLARGPTMYIQSDSNDVSSLRLVSRKGLFAVDTNTKLGAIVEVTYIY